MPDGPQASRLPPQLFFGVSAVFHYLGPSLAVLLFARLDALMLALLPACAAVIGAIVLRQFPTAQDLAGITLVVLGVALNQETRHEDRR